MDHLQKTERIKKFKETGDSRDIYQNELDKAYFQHDMAYGDFKDLRRRIVSDKMLRDKAFNITKNQKNDWYQRGLAWMVYKFFDQKSALLAWSETLATWDKSSSGGGIKNEITTNQQSVGELQKTVTRKFGKQKVHSSFINNLWGDHLADMQLISKFNKRVLFLLSCVFDIFSKYPWVVSLEDKKGITVTNASQKTLNQTKLTRKPNKIWVEKGSEFHNWSMKSWLQDNDIKMYLTDNEGKSVCCQKFIRTLKNKIYKYMNSIPINVYIDKLDDS